MNDPWLIATLRRVAILVAMSALLVGFGVSGYIIVEHFTFLEALYMTVITLATVGYTEVKPLDDAGRIFTIVLILAGAGFLTYCLIYFSQVLLDPNLIDLYRRRSLKKQLDHLEDHYVICGYGQMGQIIVEELMNRKIPIVVIDSDDSMIIRFREKGIMHLMADATEEENLIAAGIQRAKGLVAVVNKDTDNVFIVLTARDINKDMLIFARAGSPSTHRRLLKAGANRVVSPFATGAHHIAQNILRPTVTDFLELALSAEGLELSLEELVIPADAELVGKELMHSGIRSQYNLIVVAIKRRGGAMIYNPSPLEIIEAGDILIAIGPQENLLSFGRGISGMVRSTS
jgi:voltage-gated potassium channel